jgi:hypothetical protein
MGAYEHLADNTSWPKAMPLNMTGTPGSWEWTALSQTVNTRGESRWYKFTVYPGSRVVIKLNNLMVNYDLTLYTDIQAAFDELLAPENLDYLTKLTAEFAPDAYAPDAYAPDAYAPDAYAPDAYAPDAYAPDAYAPDAYAPDAYAPDAYAPDAYAPDAYAPDAYAPDAYAPDAYAPDAYAPDAYAPDEAYTSAQMNSLIAVSAFDGRAGEFIAVNTWDHTGEFYIRVKGRNGAYDPVNPYDLSVGQLSGACRWLDIGPDTTPTASAGPFETLILTDFGRMGLTPGAGDLWTRLTTLAGRPEVNGTVVDLGADPGVIFANGEADDSLNLQCPFAKNLVAKEIKEIIDAYWELNPGLKYLILVGNDHAIPFNRYPDRALLASEKEYEPPVQDDTTSYASLALGYVLSQDFYGAKIELSRNNTSLPIPRLAVGRLVEEPGDIIAFLDTYLGTSSSLVPTSSLVTGYDFLADAATEIAYELSTGIGAPAETLITDKQYSPRDPDPSVWDAATLNAALLGRRHDVVFLAGHFSANSALAADFETHFLATDIVGASPGIFENTVVFSAGCHSGYNIVNPHGILGLTLEPDWAQAFVQKGANLIAGTGYQYGETEFMEYGERLYWYFSRFLRAGSGPVAIGDALVAAKNRYLANTPELRGIHEKTLMEATLYGLPMFSVDMPHGRNEPIDQPASIVGTPTTFLTKPGVVLGLAFADVSSPFNLTYHSKTLKSVKIGDSSQITTAYLSGDKGVVARPGEPVLPLETYDVSVPGTVLRGIGFRGGGYFDHTNVIPLTGAPATEVRGVHPPFWTDVYFPIRTWNANYFDALSKETGGITALALTPAQFLSDGPDTYTGVLREYIDMDFRLYYNHHLTKYQGETIVPILSAAPTIAKVNALASGGNVDFSVYVTGDPNVGIQEVWVTYTCEGDGVEPCYSEWVPLDLTQNPLDSRLWEGTLPLNSVPGEDLRYILQAVNGTGLVALNTNLGYYFTPNVDPAEPPTLGEETNLTLQLGWSSDHYGAYVPMRAFLKDSSNIGIPGEVVYFALGSQKRAVRTNEYGTAHLLFPLLSPPGNYRVRAAFIGNMDNQESAAWGAVTITKQPTTLSIDPVSPSIESGDTQEFTLSLKDSQGRPLLEKTVFTFVRQNGNDLYAFKNTTNYLGEVVLKVSGPPDGYYTIDNYFSGSFSYLGRQYTLDDPTYESSSATATLTSIDNLPPAVDEISVSLDPIDINDQPVNTSATFNDPAGAQDEPFTCTIDYGDGTDPETGNVDGFTCLGPDHTYEQAGVYLVTFTITDKDGNTGTASAEEYFVIYDSSEGFVTGGGWIHSPAGACQTEACDPETTGKATFGFVSKYKKGANVPTGETEFHFNAGDLKFHSTEYDWLVVAGSKAKFKGIGTINGAGVYKFMISAFDGKDTGDPDTFRIKIWEEVNGVERVIYDNQMGDDDLADATTELGGGSITVHTKKK